MMQYRVGKGSKHQCTAIPALAIQGRNHRKRVVIQSLQKERKEKEGRKQQKRRRMLSAQSKSKRKGRVLA